MRCKNTRQTTFVHLLFLKAKKPANEEVKLFFSCVVAFKTIEAKNIPFGQYFLKRMKKSY